MQIEPMSALSALSNHNATQMRGVTNENTITQNAMRSLVPRETIPEFEMIETIETQKLDLSQNKHTVRETSEVTIPTQKTAGGSKFQTTFRSKQLETKEKARKTLKNLMPKSSETAILFGKVQNKMINPRTANMTVMEQTNYCANRQAIPDCHAHEILRKENNPSINKGKLRHVDQAIGNVMRRYGLKENNPYPKTNLQNELREASALKR